MKNNNISNLPSPSVGGLSVYLSQIKKFPMLDAEEEYMLAKNWRENGNLQLRKQEDCLPNHKKGKAIIYAKRKQCDKLNGKIKDKLIKGSSVDNNKYYPCEFEVCNREYK